MDKSVRKPSCLLQARSEMTTK